MIFLFAFSLLHTLYFDYDGSQDWRKQKSDANTDGAVFIFRRRGGWLHAHDHRQKLIELNTSEEARAETDDD
jgi:hypothetical protein